MMSHEQLVATLFCEFLSNSCGSVSCPVIHNIFSSTAVPLSCLVTELGELLPNVCSHSVSSSPNDDDDDVDLDDVSDDDFDDN